MKLLAGLILTLTLTMGCSEESEGDDDGSNRIGPENAITNTASEAEFNTDVDNLVLVFDDFNDTKKTFLGSTSANWVLPIAAFQDSEMPSININIPGNEPLVDGDEEKQSFSAINSCSGSFQVTDGMIAQFKTQVEEMIKHLKEGKLSSEQSSAQSVGSLKLNKVETDDAIAYDIVAEQATGQNIPEDAISISGRISGRYNKDAGQFQFYNKMSTFVDYAAVIEAAKSQNQNDISDWEEFLNSLSYVLTSDVESTIEGNTSTRTFTTSQYIKSDIQFPKDSTKNSTLAVNIEASLTGGDSPKVVQMVQQEFTNAEGTQTFNLTFSMELSAEKELTVKAVGDAGDDAQDFTVEYKLKAGETASDCAIEK